MKRIFFILILAGAACTAEAETFVAAQPGKEAFYKLYNQALTAHTSSRLGEACKYYAQAADMAAELDDAHWEYGRAVSLLAMAYHTRGNYAQAGKYYQLSIEYYRKYKLRELGVAVSGLGRLYLEQGQAQKAAPLLKEAAELTKADQAQGVAPYELADAYSSLARLNELLGNKKTAETYYKAAVELFKDAPVSFPFKVLDAEQMDSYPIILFRTGYFYAKNGRPESAGAYFARSLKAFENWLPLDDRPALKARVLDYRGRTLKALGRAAESEADLREAAGLYKRIREQRVN
ncbi:MAG TPA: hypothetical protein DCZ92_07325 [Elusimicrobia bacterium]|nr:MAG: hypothetical protein A2016_02680 [Elusimicrobia bacterium GWF2_62_30]HBA60617.1 hypothetical protein [Elusimicrobiota bacterium]